MRLLSLTAFVGCGGEGHELRVMGWMGSACQGTLCWGGGGGGVPEASVTTSAWTREAARGPLSRPAPPSEVCPSALPGSGVVSLVVEDKESGEQQEHPQLAELGGQIFVSPGWVGK